MSLYFNWSCDFQRFTKSKKLSKFQVRTTTLFISNKILSTSLFNLQGTIRCFKKLSFSFAACLLYQMKFRLSRTFFKTFSKFLKQFSQNSNFSDRRLFRNSLFIISNRNPFVKNFFRSFQAAKNAIINLPQRSSPRGKFFYYKKSEWRCKNGRSKKSN